MKTTLTTTAIICLLAHSLMGLAQDADPQSETGKDLRVSFQLNDALIKGKVLSEVGIGIARQTLPAIDGQAGADSKTIVAQGATDEKGRFEVSLSPGTYLVSYRKKGYVPIDSSPTEINADGQIVTTTLTMLLESEGRGQRRIKVILNWGSDHSDHVKDADSHLAPQGGSGDDEVYFLNQKVKTEAGLVAELDVDDVDWGGPETITLLEPPPGSSFYWVHNFSGGSASLGGSEVVVRVIVDDRVVGEYRPDPQVSSRDWRPFKTLSIDAMLAVQVVEFSEQEMANSAHLRPPPGQWSEGGSVDCDSCDYTTSAAIAIGLLLLWIISAFVKRRR